MEEIERIVEKAIPIYTVKNKSPKGKADCAIVKDYKEQKRKTLRLKLETLIAEYEQRVKQNTE